MRTCHIRKSKTFFFFLPRGSLLLYYCCFWRGKKNNNESSCTTTTFILLHDDDEEGDGTMLLLGISVHVYSWWRLPFFSFRFSKSCEHASKKEWKHECMLYMYMSPEKKKVICTTFICTFLVILDDDELYTYILYVYICLYAFGLYSYMVFWKKKGRRRRTTFTIRPTFLFLLKENYSDFSFTFMTMMKGEKWKW